MTPLEKDIEKHLGRMIGSLGGVCLKWVCPGFAGVPDRICLLPRGRIVFVELKRPDGGVTAPRQRVWNKRIRDLGFPCYFVRNHEDIVALRDVLTREFRNFIIVDEPREEPHDRKNRR